MADDRTQVRIDPGLERELAGRTSDAILEMDRRSSATLTPGAWEDWKALGHRLVSGDSRRTRR